MRTKISVATDLVPYFRSLYKKGSFIRGSRVT